jgi:NurA-like 5'-3' nuclease
MDQCHKGYGYPVALSEAHEQAVVTNNDRENLYQLIDELMIKNGITPSTSLKSRSKHTRWI